MGVVTLSVLLISGPGDSPQAPPPRPVRSLEQLARDRSPSPMVRSFVAALNGGRPEGVTTENGRLLADGYRAQARLFAGLCGLVHRTRQRYGEEGLRVVGEALKMPLQKIDSEEFNKVPEGIKVFLAESGDGTAVARVPGWKQEFLMLRKGGRWYVTATENEAFVAGLIAELFPWRSEPIEAATRAVETSKSLAELRESMKKVAASLQKP